VTLSPAAGGALHAVPAAGDRRRHPAPAHLVFFHGPMVSSLS
jgi:thymidine kinase